IHYSISKAESTKFPDNHFDLITVGQALHWFNFEAFFKEVKRVLKLNGTLAVWGYNNMLINPEIDKINLDFYQNITKPYWDGERKHIDNQYSDIDFPFEKIESKSFEIIKKWNLPNLEGFFNTLSAEQHFITKEGYSPVPKLIDRFKPIWKEGEMKVVRFPLFLKLLNKL
ncbi:MAG: class I SAM-dependent methyltransferase, partial [Cyclobacteriaceae bacterium]|nr:class I SAM-dependent methyltransferase [Cyclobacteriaceae bacterium]